MDKIFEILTIHSEGEIILSHDEFDRFVNEMNLPIFKNEFKTDKYKHEVFLTVFNGVIIRRLIELPKLNAVETQKGSIKVPTSKIE